MNTIQNKKDKQMKPDASPCSIHGDKHINLDGHCNVCLKGDQVMSQARNLKEEKMNQIFENALKDPIPGVLTKVLETKSLEEIEEIVSKVYKEYPVMMKEFRRILDQMYIVFALKQNDYGPGNIALGTKLENQNEINVARRAVLIRTYDKLNRMVNLDLLHNVEPTNESLEDSWEDTAVYSVIAQLVMRGVWGK